MSVLFCLIGAAVAGTVKPSAVDSSSYLVDESGEAYEAKGLSDGKLNSAWFEGDDSSGLGSTVKFDLGGPKTVTGMKMWNGYWYSQDQWSRHNRAKDIEVEFSDGSKESFTLTDNMSVEQVRFKAAKSTESIQIKLKSIYRGSTFNHTGFSEIQILDQSPSPFVVPSSYTASSTLPPDGENYDAANLHDGIVDSMWCEGNADGDGKGESITFDFGSATSVSKLQLRNGSAGSFSSFMATNRAKSAKLTFSDGSSTDVAIKTSLMPQTIAFPSKSTSTVVVTFTDVAKGSQYNDLCISEATFSK